MKVDLQTGRFQSGTHQCLNGKISLRVGPYSSRCPAGTARQLAKGFHRIFVTALGVNGLGFAEFDDTATKPDLLAFAADQMHFDTLALGVVERLVTKCVEIEIGA